MGLEFVVEYENQSGEPRWAAPKNARWDYTVFGNSGLAAEPDETIKFGLRRFRVDAAITTDGPSTANHGPTPTRFSPFSKASATGLSWIITAETKSGAYAPLYL